MFSHVICKFLLTLSFITIIYAAKSESTINKPEKCGLKASSSSTVRIHYRSRVWGQEEYFESTYIREAPLEVKLGNGNLLKGIEDGIHGMCTGEIRRLLIPPNQAYGAIGIPNLVPPNTAIVVDVEMVNVNSPFSLWFWISGLILFSAFLLFGRKPIKGDTSNIKKKE
ncbi:FK506-binding protein 2A [Rhizopus delemar RA 99-880]|uniref:FK506-binding protein 2A n=1 Tax=Rhizopus delemar (strain RA 99-880 / ATCC MYA-4621 / FGSC 9543 / NRRL 43880) TaxID=246409 RepID=FKB2A_RHIO9|nr:RecName: Full=FK506-binding protein 2A; AltName: Full=Peptidyl-prolyl cis-trans isomerase; Short=PPIase; AltName: Full=Rotamase; Flags: Precursor [Rhizopus delemar RA 99-880]EIE82004.1 FK506-binding protein 2A [Rhizopus delemar RA 99-880]|eukprot:EIE82004.1 FK506-binding protein 2A [Rhizopus delemar RA 99-880]